MCLLLTYGAAGAAGVGGVGEVDVENLIDADSYCLQSRPIDPKVVRQFVDKC